MSKGLDTLPDSGMDPGNLADDDLSTNQQAIAVPVFWGEAKFPMKWLSDPFKQFTKDAPVARPGKK